MTDKVACTVEGCENLILPSTVEETGGACKACVSKQTAEERRAYIEANRVDVDRFAGLTDRVEILKIMEERPSFDPLINHVPYKAPRWQVYSELTPPELEAMSRYAVSMLASDKDAAGSIAGALASFTSHDLTGLHEAFLDQADDWPPHCFWRAEASTRDRVVQGLEGREIPPNLGLLTLAWIGDAEVARLFCQWREASSTWAEQLYIPPHQYAKCGGWELSAGGDRRELFFTPCYSLIPTGRDSGTGVVAVQDQDATCPWCSQKLVAMLTADLRDPEFVDWQIGLPRVTITTCHVCACYGHVFCDLSSDGSSVWSAHNVRPDYLPDDSAEWGRMPTDCLAVVKESRSPHFADDWTGDAPISQVGGLPSWIQDPEYPSCPKCRQTMKFLGQISNEEIEDHSEGIYYMFLCASCRIGATNYQQT